MLLLAGSLWLYLPTEDAAYVQVGGAAASVTSRARESLFEDATDLIIVRVSESGAAGVAVGDGRRGRVTETGASVRSRFRPRLEGIPPLLKGLSERVAAYGPSRAESGADPAATLLDGLAEVTRAVLDHDRTEVAEPYRAVPGAALAQIHASAATSLVRAEPNVLEMIERLLALATAEPLHG